MFDIAIRTIEDQEETSRLYEFDEENGSVFLTTGIRMLVQNWVKHYLTEVGTHPTDPDYGTVVPRLIESNVSSETQVFVTLEQAVTKTNNYIQTVQQQNDVDDPASMLQDGSLESVSIQQQGSDVEATITLENQRSDRIRVVTRGLRVLVNSLE